MAKLHTQPCCLRIGQNSSLQSPANSHASRAYVVHLQLDRCNIVAPDYSHCTSWA